MTAPSLDILGIGNAIVDVIARAEPELLRRQGLTPGEMRLVDTAEADALYAVMGPGTESSGGSAGNTCAVAAGLGAHLDAHPADLAAWRTRVKPAAANTSRSRASPACAPSAVRPCDSAPGVQSMVLPA